MADSGSRKAILVGFAVAFICAILVSTAAVLLKPLQMKNQLFEKKRNIVLVSELIKDPEVVSEKKVAKLYSSSVLPVLIELKTGLIIREEDAPELLKVKNYDLKEIMRNKSLTFKIPPDQDLAKIRVIPTHILAYYIVLDGRKQRIILTVYGKGLWSTMYGFLAMDMNCKTIRGITFYEHGETPGLGGEISNPLWQEKWKDKIAYDENWQPIITVIKGKVRANTSMAESRVDGLSGATLTSVGVDNTIKFWLGEYGFKTFLKKVKEKMDE
jgi:Na+-transporting NADH:ubiquinone oxidoreductase subunit C